MSQGYITLVITVAWLYITMLKFFITLAPRANLDTVVIYCRILTVENIGTTVNYNGTFITLTPSVKLEILW